MEHDGLIRWFLVYVPTNLPVRSPAVVLLHGGTGGMRGIFNQNQSTTREWPYLAEREKFVLYVPNGVNPDTGDTYGDEQNWNDLREPGSDRDSDEDDVGFLRKVLDNAIKVRDADPLRVYVTGSSNGGTMSMRLAMELSGRISAAAVAIANLPDYEGLYSEPTRPVPFLFLNGTEDPLMIYEGSPGGVKSAAETVAWWIERNKSSPVPAEDSYLPDLDANDNCIIRRQSFPALGGGAPVSFLIVEGGGHVTPSINHHIPQNPLILRLIGRQCHDVETAEVQWNFLRQFSLPLNPVLTIFKDSTPTDDPASLHLALSGGHPAGYAILEASPMLLNPQWSEVDAVYLDDLGDGEFTPSVVSGSVGFFRAKSMPEEAEP